MSWKTLHETGKFFSRVKKRQGGSMIGTIVAKDEVEATLIRLLKTEAIGAKVHVRKLIMKILAERYNIEGVY